MLRRLHAQAAAKNCPDNHIDDNARGCPPNAIADAAPIIAPIQLIVATHRAMTAAMSSGATSSYLDVRGMSALHGRDGNAASPIAQALAFGNRNIRAVRAQWPVAVEARSPAAALIAVNVSEVDDVGRELMKRLRRPKRVSPALPTPVASGPYPTVAVPDPASRNPCCAHIRCRDICARHPDILDAIPAPVAGLPDISGGRRGGHRLDHGRGRGNADDHANARETGTGSERQCRSAEKGKDRSSVHAGDPGSCFSSVKPSTDAAGVLP